MGIYFVHWPSRFFKIFWTGGLFVNFYKGCRVPPFPSPGKGGRPLNDGVDGVLGGTKERCRWPFRRESCGRRPWLQASPRRFDPLGRRGTMILRTIIRPRRVLGFKSSPKPGSEEENLMGIRNISDRHQKIFWWASENPLMRMRFCRRGSSRTSVIDSAMKSIGFSVGSTPRADRVGRSADAPERVPPADRRDRRDSYF